MYKIHSNYPNPFSYMTTLEFDSNISGLVQISVYDILGQRVRLLLNENKGIGNHVIQWDGKNDKGQDLPSGTYFVQMKANGFDAMTKAVIMNY